MEAVKTKKESYLIEGMTCAGCERTISKVIGSIDGVQHAKADLSSASVSVEYDPHKVTIDNIKAAVNKVGYKFVGERPAYGQREGSDEAIA
ncbi:heavy-metal-associated domain-containing protein [Chryseosolibacter indicus]|uniref:Heavy-metal-associated domain-containing protein n=1 Tax=Chryseosolibacter indicus TaxID=2782351 RepID=A0ABS5VK35_9BACT|nr:cation transporter [Chryseosolibacter indicus]MBT1701802.1 heavy-metal-associated domain-containing protein [Chryseosolibacter indicus]